MEFLDRPPWHVPCNINPMLHLLFFLHSRVSRKTCSPYGFSRTNANATLHRPSLFSCVHGLEKISRDEANRRTDIVKITMNRDRDDQTRRFLEDLIEMRRRSDSIVFLSNQRESLSDRDQKLLKQEQQLQHQMQLLQRRNSIQSYIVSRQHQHTINSPISASLHGEEPPLRCEASRFPTLECLGSFNDGTMGMFQRQRGGLGHTMQHQQKQLQRGSLVGRMRYPGYGKGAVYPSLIKTTRIGNRDLTTSLNGTSNLLKQHNMTGNMKQQYHNQQSLSSNGFPSPLAAAMDMALFGAHNSNLSPQFSSHRPSDMRIPRLKDSQFFLPPLPFIKGRSSATKKKIKMPMKSYKILWRNNMTIFDSLFVRTEVFSRAVSRAKVKIRDNSKTLPPTPPFRVQFSSASPRV
jgi:hypothetical protein